MVLETLRSNLRNLSIIPFVILSSLPSDHQVEELKRELEEMRQLAEELHAALRTQHAEKLKLQVTT